MRGRIRAYSQGMLARSVCNARGKLIGEGRAARTAATPRSMPERRRHARKIAKHRHQCRMTLEQYRRAERCSASGYSERIGSYRQTPAPSAAVSSCRRWPRAPASVAAETHAEAARQAERSVVPHTSANRRRNCHRADARCLHSSPPAPVPRPSSRHASAGHRPPAPRAVCKQRQTQISVRLGIAQIHRQRLVQQSHRLAKIVLAVFHMTHVMHSTKASRPKCRGSIAATWPPKQSVPRRFPRRPGRSANSHSHSYAPIGMLHTTQEDSSTWPN